MNRWTFGAAAWDVSGLFLVCYINSKVDLLNWFYGGEWWHLPVGATVILAFIVCGACIFAKGAMISIHGRGWRKPKTDAVGEQR